MDAVARQKKRFVPVHVEATPRRSVQVTSTEPARAMADQYAFEFDRSMGYSVGGMLVSQLLAQGIEAAHSIDHPMHGQSRVVVTADDREAARALVEAALRAVAGHLEAARERLPVT